MPVSMRAHWLAPSRATRLLIGSMLAIVVAQGCATQPAPSVAGTVPSPATNGTSSPSTAVPEVSPEPAPTDPAGSGLVGLASACDLTTAEEVSSVLGGPAPVPEVLPGGGWVASQCAWKSPTTGFMVSIGTPESISAFGDPKIADAASRLAEYGERMGSPATAREMPGLGDAAILGPTGIAVSTDGIYVEILRQGLTDEQLVEVAKLVVGKL